MKIQNAMLSIGLFLLRLAILILIVVGIYRVGETSFDYCYRIVSDLAVDEEPGRDVSVVVTGDMDEKELAELLERKGLIENAKIFRIQLKLNDYDDKLETGSYVLNTSMTAREMMAVLAGETDDGEES